MCLKVSASAVKLYVLAFTKGRKQLPAADVLSTRKLASVRVHVERVIGLIRNKYVILKATLPVDYVVCRRGDITPLDKIVTVCCALYNSYPSIVALQKQNDEACFSWGMALVQISPIYFSP